MSDKADNFTWKTRWVMRRNALLGSARFQRWASRTPLIRGIARRRAAAQFDLIAGFVYSQILSAYVTSGLIEFLNGELRSSGEIARFARLGPDATERLLRAGDALQIAESPQDGLWTLGEAGAPLSANTGAMAMVRHHHVLYRDLSEPLALLANSREKETALSAYWTYASKDAGSASADASNYSALMAATQPMVSQQIVDAYDFSAHRAMLDIGGGSGAFLVAIAAVAPALRFGIFDLSDVVAQAEARLAHECPTIRIDYYGGSFKKDSLPQGYDLVTLVRVLHDHDDDVAQALLVKIYQALPAGGRLLLAEPMADSAQATRMGNAYFGLYLWAMNSGRPRSVAEIREMLAKADFAKVENVKTALPLIASGLVATK